MIEEIEERLKVIQSEETNRDRYFVFHYNCWQHDYYEEPAVAIISAMLTSIKEDEAFLSKDIDNTIRAGYGYEFSTDNTKELNVLELLKYNTEWLDFITPNRHEGEAEIVYDLIYDRMADSAGDELTAYIDLYWHKEISADTVLKAIKFRDAKFDQYCFKTQKALGYLKRISCMELYKFNMRPKMIKRY